MRNNMVDKKNYEKFIFKGALALECYFDATNENQELFDEFNKKLKDYRSLDEKTAKDKEYIVNILLSTFKKIGQDYFLIYEDGDVEYNYKTKKRNDSNIK